MSKVRIAVDKTKASSFLVEVLVESIWVEKYRFKSKKRAQEFITGIFKNSEQDKDFIYERNQ